MSIRFGGLREGDILLVELLDEELMMETGKKKNRNNDSTGGLLVVGSIQNTWQLLDLNDTPILHGGVFIMHCGAQHDLFVHSTRGSFVDVHVDIHVDII